MEIFGLIYLYEQIVSTFGPLIFFILYYFGIEKHDIKNPTIINNIHNRTYMCTEFTHSDEPSGYLIGKWFYAVSTNGGGIKLICHKNLYIELQKNVDCNTDKSVVSQKTLNYLYDFDSTNKIENGFISSIRTIKKLTPTEEQQSVIDKILDVYSAQKFCTVVLTGETGTGKSSIGYILANHFIKKSNVSFTNTFDLTIPNEKFGTLYNSMSRKSGTSIIVFDEFDRLMYNLHYGKIEKMHKKYIKSVYDKSTWNLLLDKINFGYYKNVIILFTSNKTMKWFNELDPSYIRDGRIDLKIEMKNKCI